MKNLAEIGSALLIVMLLPLWMILGVGALAYAVGRQLYWFARGNATPLATLAGRAPLSRAERGFSLGRRWRRSKP